MPKTPKKNPLKKALRKKRAQNSFIFNDAYTSYDNGHTPRFFCTKKAATSSNKKRKPEATLVAEAPKVKKNTTKNTAPPPASLGTQFLDALEEHSQTYLCQSNSANFGDFADIEASCIEVKPVSVLASPGNTSYWGAFARVDLKGPLLLGEYFGEIKDVPEEGSRKEKSIADDAFYNSFQLTPTTALVPRKEEEFWPKKANCAPCEQLANIEIRPYGQHVMYAIPRGVKIARGSQLLPFYGEAYTFESKVFLNPTDTDETSLEKLVKYPYRAGKVDRQLLRHLDIPTSTAFYIPVVESLDNSTIHLPLLARRKAGEVLPQYEQENLCLLHIACWTANESLLNAALTKGANPNQCARKTGFNALHAIVLSPYYTGTAQKVEYIERLKLAGAHLILQDDHERSALHHAIQQNDSELAKALIQLEPKLLTLVNKDDRDFFSYAISIGAVDMLTELAPFITAKYLNEYLKDEEEFDYLVKTLKKLRKSDAKSTFDATEAAVMSLCQEKKPLLYERLLMHFEAPIPATQNCLGL
ncbi:MAG: ankyrin repeat domain-containing protein [Legionellaceae bacterium]|nr:ankyrin repeat domain-containing protein [Legionellaceae bacterium]